MIAKLEIDIHNALKWFESNLMVANPTEFQVMFLGLKKNQTLPLEINDEAITTFDEMKLLVVIIDSKLNFISRVKARICRSQSQNERTSQIISQTKPNSLLLTETTLLKALTLSFNRDLSPTRRYLTTCILQKKAKCNGSLRQHRFCAYLICAPSSTL